MNSANIVSVASFIARYKAFDETWCRQHFGQFCSGFQRLQAGLAEAQVKAAEERRRTAYSFNVFRVLDRVYDEVGTHSRLLANLLDPHGSHGQGPLFLEIFLRRTKDALPGAPELPDPLPAQGWMVRTESSMAYGSMDLVISSPHQGYLIVIENKLLAGEQPEQLARYSRWLEEQSHYPYRALFYLTPDGRPSYTSGDAVYHLLSYRLDIAGWLRESLELIEAPRLADLLTQYMAVLNDL